MVPTRSPAAASGRGDRLMVNLGRDSGPRTADTLPAIRGSGGVSLRKGLLPTGRGTERPAGRSIAGAKTRPRRAIDRPPGAAPRRGPGARFDDSLGRSPGRRPEEVLTKSRRPAFRAGPFPQK